MRLHCSSLRYLIAALVVVTSNSSGCSFLLEFPEMVLGLFDCNMKHESAHMSPTNIQSIKVCAFLLIEAFV